MWLPSTAGFVSVVCKPGDREQGALTVRARVRRDLEDLRDQYLCNMEEIVETPLADYGYRAQVPRESFASAMKHLAMGIRYDNFKDAVHDHQGPNRASLYAEVWRLLAMLADQGTEWSRDEDPATGDPDHGTS